MLSGRFSRDIPLMKLGESLTTISTSAVGLTALPKPRTSGVVYPVEASASAWQTLDLGSEKQQSFGVLVDLPVSTDSYTPYSYWFRGWGSEGSCNMMCFVGEIDDASAVAAGSEVDNVLVLGIGQSGSSSGVLVDQGHVGLKRSSATGVDALVFGIAFFGTGGSDPGSMTVGGRVAVQRLAAGNPKIHNRDIFA